MTENNKTIRTRFAPSPTGFVHVGNFRTALFSFLFARHNGGTSILRVEDTDQSRFVEGAMENMISVLSRMGVEFDEGVVFENGHLTEKGDKGPYTQSHRLDIYKKYAEELLSAKKVYYCFCSPERLDEVRKEQMALKKPAMYDRFCRNLSDAEISQKMSELESSGKSPVVRQANPLEGKTVVHDLVYGDIVYDNSILDDHVLIKSDGFPTYHFAVVVDDHLMEISHVIRGEEWLPSAPKHVLLYQAFGWQAPAFAHMPLILNPDKSKLSKRQGDVAVEDFLKKGYLPEALTNFVAFLGWNPKTEQELFSMQDLIESFDLAKVNKSGAVFDIAKLDWINGEYIRAKSNSELVELVKPYWQESGFDLAKFDNSYLEGIMALEKDRLKKLSEISERTKYFFNSPEIDATKLVWKKSTPKETQQNLRLLQDLFRIQSDDVMGDITKLEEVTKAFIAEHEFDNGSILWPLRYVMTGEDRSPSPFEVTATVFQGWGREEVMSRLEKGISIL